MQKRANEKIIKTYFSVLGLLIPVNAVRSYSYRTKYSN